MTDIVTKSPAPRASGEGAGQSLSSMSLSDIQGVASSALDPMKGRFVREDDPRAKAILAKQQERIQNAKTTGRIKGPQNAKALYEPGHRVYHARRKMYGVVSKYSQDGKRIEVIFPRGEKALVQLANLQKV